MRNSITKTSLLTACGLMALLGACEEEKKAPPPNETVTTASVAPATPAPPPATAPVPAKEETAGARPEKIQTELTDERRSALETKYADAKGFLLAKDLENKLRGDKKIKDKKAAISAFDKAAKGKWILFSGPLVNLTDDGFDLGIVYTSQMANDPLGMSRQFFEVTMKEIEGYSKDKFKAGNVVVVLAKYKGDGKAGPGYEVVESGAWK
jgi:hypothetical protein